MNQAQKKPISISGSGYFGEDTEQAMIGIGSLSIIAPMNKVVTAVRNGVDICFRMCKIDSSLQIKGCGLGGLRLTRASTRHHFSLGGFFIGVCSFHSVTASIMSGCLVGHLKKCVAFDSCSLSANLLGNCSPCLGGRVAVQQ